MDEGSRDRDIDLNGAVTVQDARKHSDSLFGEDKRHITTPAPHPNFEVAICDLKILVTSGVRRNIKSEGNL